VYSLTKPRPEAEAGWGFSFVRNNARAPRPFWTRLAFRRRSARMPSIAVDCHLTRPGRDLPCQPNHMRLTIKVSVFLIKK
jgi:hypothetical protein